MPSSEVRYQRGDVYRHHDEDILRARRSSSVSSSSVKARAAAGNHTIHLGLGGHGGRGGDRHGKHFGSVTSAENAAIRQKLNRLPVKSTADEEYLTTKKVEVKTTKNTERRVQRCVVLEDGRVIEHDDPHVVVDRIEDTQTHEFDHLEDRDLNEELKASILRSYQKAGVPMDYQERRKSIVYDNANTNVNKASAKAANPAAHGGNPGVVAVTSHRDGDVVGDTFKRIVNTHDVQEKVVRTHAAKDLGMISKRGLRKVLKNKGKVSDYLLPAAPKKSDGDEGSNRGLVREYRTDSHKRIVDTEDIHEISRRNKDGQLHKETVRTEKHEVFDNRAAPDSSNRASGSSETEVEKDEQGYRVTKRDEYTDYYDKAGNMIMNGPHLTSKDVKLTVQEPHTIGQDKWRIVSEDRIRQSRASMKKRLRPDEDAERTDALTKRPLDLNREEKTRIKETDKWLERHFGSDWSLANDNSSLLEGKFKYMNLDGAGFGSHGHHHHGHGKTTSQFDPSRVKRTMSFSSIPVNYGANIPGEKISRVIKQTTTTLQPGFDKHVVSSVTKSLVPNPYNGQGAGGQESTNNETDSYYYRRHRSLDAAKQRPYHSTMTLNTHGHEGKHAKKNASTTSLLNGGHHHQNETSRLTLRQVPITRLEYPDSPSRPPRKSRVQRLIEERRSQNGGSATSVRSSSTQVRRRPRPADEGFKRRSYYFGEDLHDRVQSEPPRHRQQQHGGQRHHHHHQQQQPCPQPDYHNVHQSSTTRRYHTEERAAPLYRTELRRKKLFPSNDLVSDREESQSMINRNNWRNELSKSYNDIPNNSYSLQPQNLNTSSQHRQHSRNYYSELSRQKEEMSKSYQELPKQRPLFSWRDEFELPGGNGLGGGLGGGFGSTMHQHTYQGFRSMERSDGVPLQKSTGGKVKRSQSFAVGTTTTTSSQSSTSEASYNLLRPHHLQQTSESKSYKKTKVTSPPKSSYDHYFPAADDIIVPPKEFAGLNANIQDQYNEAKRTLRESRVYSEQKRQSHQHHHQHQQHRHHHSKSASKTKSKTTSSNKAGIKHKPGKSAAADAVYEFEQKIPMQSSSLEAQKFKTVIFVSGR